MRPRNGFASLLIVALLLPLSSYAGEKLHLKSGIIDPLNIVDSQVVDEKTESFFIVQFHAAPTSEDRQSLKRLGFHTWGYVPDDALLVEVPDGVNVSNFKSQNLRSVVPYHWSYRLSPAFTHINVFNAGETVGVTVRLFGQKFRSDILAFFAANGVDLVQDGDKNLIIYTRRGLIPQIAGLAGVEFVEEPAQIQLHYLDVQNSDVKSFVAGDYSDITGYESGTLVMKFDQAWQRGLMGQGQIVAMADTGLDTGEIGQLHQDFKTVMKGYTFGLYSDSWKDPMGHGTHVAGSVISTGAASGGKITGGAYGAGFIAEGLWSEMMGTLTVPPRLEKLLAPAYADGARVHTNSWGNPRALGAYDNMAIQVDEFVWGHPEMLVVFAAGNSGVDKDRDGRIDEGSVTSPGTAKNALTVGASENYLITGGIQRKVGDLAGGQWSAEPLGSDLLSNNADGIAVFSSRGPTNDGRIKPDVVAPGTNILSNCSQVPGASPLWGNYNKDYCYSGGTSMSAPLVAGAAAVVRENLVKNLNLTNPSAAAVKAVLLHTADDLFPGQFGSVGKAQGQELLSPAPNPHEGFGRVNMDRATANSYQVYDEVVGLSNGETKTFTIDTAGRSHVKLTLVYMDPPALASAAKTLVNDLSLQVLKGGEALESNDTTNNFEVAHINLNGENSIEVSVIGSRIINGPQPYALVVE